MTSTPHKQPHTSVLVEEMLEQFAGQNLRVFVEGTVGAGGHAEAMLQNHPEIECYIGFDQDETALEIAANRLQDWKDKVILVNRNFSAISEVLRERGISHVDGFFLT